MGYNYREMKPALIAAITLVLLVHFAPRGNAQKNTAEKGQSSRSEHPAALAAAPPLAKANPQNGPQRNQRAADGQSPHWYKSPEWVLVIVGAITAFVIGWQSWESRKAATAAADSVEAVNRQVEVMERQTVATEKAAHATAESVVLAADTAKRQLRAYVCVSSALLKFKTPFIPEVQVHFKNFGQTPAYDFHGWIGMYIGNYPLTASLPDGGHIPMGREDLPPSRMSIHVIERDPPIEPQLIPLLGTPQGTIYVFGEMIYRDAFGTQRHLRYRLMHGGREGARPVKDKEGKITGYLLKTDTEGNETN